MDDDSRSVEELRLEADSLAVELESERERRQELENDLHWQRLKLEEAVEVMVSVGKVHDTPSAKRAWVEGGRG